MRSRINNIPLIFFAVFILILINVTQFPAIRQEAGKRWGALYKIKHRDVTHESNFKKFKLYERSSVYYDFGRLAPDSALIIPEDNPFVRKDDFKTKLVLLGKVSQIESIKLSNADAWDESISMSNNLVDEGVMLMASGSRINNVPNIKWGIYYHKSPGKRFVFVHNEEITEWRIIDASLFSEKFLREIR